METTILSVFQLDQLPRQVHCAALQTAVPGWEGVEGVASLSRNAAKHVAMA